jgi:PAS domain S-box-containing protein
MHYQDLTHPDDLENDLDGLTRMKHGEIQTFQMEKRYISKHGEIIPVFLSACFVRDEEGTPLYCIGHILDMRDRLEIDRMKDEFVSVVSHELRTPITANPK